MANAVELGHRLLAAHEYSNQKRELEKRHQTNGTDVFVAKLSIVTSKTNGHSFTYTVWPPVPTMLPEAEFVGVSAGENDIFFVPWESAASIAGDYWKPCLDLEPLRVYAERFPLPPLIEQLRSFAVDPGAHSAGTRAPVPMPPGG